MRKNKYSNIIYGLSAWAISGLLIAWWLIFYISYNRYFPDYITLSLYLIAASVVMGGIVTLIVLLIFNVLKRTVGLPNWRFFNPGIIVAALGFGFFFAARILSARGIINVVSGRAILWHIISLILGIATALLGSYILTSLKMGIRVKASIMTFALVLMIFLVPVVFGPSLHGKQRVDLSAIDVNATGLKVVLIGIDGACWDVIDPLLDRGEVPAFRKFREEGVTGILKSNRTGFLPMTLVYGMGTLSASIWETIATGLQETDHHIFDFSTISLPGLKNSIPMTLALPAGRNYLVNATSRQGMRIWEILDKRGLKTATVKWIKKPGSG
jgi:hypothetical protein